MRKALCWLVTLYCAQIRMCLLNRDLLDASVCLRNMVFPKSNVKYKHSLPCKVRVSSSRHLNAEKCHPYAVLRLRHCRAWGGVSTLPSGGSINEGKAAPVWSLPAEVLPAYVEQEENALALEDTICCKVKCRWPSPVGISGALWNRISLLSVLWRPGLAASIMAKSWLCKGIAAQKRRTSLLFNQAHSHLQFSQIVVELGQKLV